MLTFLLIICVLGYGLKKLCSFAKENPERTAQLGSLLRGLFR